MIKDLKLTLRLREKSIELSVLLCSSQGLYNLACVICFSFRIHFVLVCNMGKTSKFWVGADTWTRGGKFLGG